MITILCVYTLLFRDKHKQWLPAIFYHFPFKIFPLYKWRSFASSQAKLPFRAEIACLVMWIYLSMQTDRMKLDSIMEMFFLGNKKESEKEKIYSRYIEQSTWNWNELGCSYASMLWLKSSNVCIVMFIWGFGTLDTCVLRILCARISYSAMTAN